MLALTAFAYLTFIAVVLAFDSFQHRVSVFGDSQSYSVAAAAIRDWRPASITPYHFWGLPYLAAALSLLTGASTLSAVVIVSVVASVVALMLIHRLWGGWTAGVFLVLSWEWLQRSLLGGAEPVFLAFVGGAFLAARHGRWNLSAVLASYSVTIRPQGMFVLIGIAVALLAERKFRQLGFVTLIGAVVGALYMIPFQVYYGDALANFHFYQSQDWHTGSPVSLPLVAMARAMYSSSVPWTTIARELFWVVVCVAGALAMLLTSEFRRYAREHKAEAVFAGLFLWFVFSYNSQWSWLEFARYSLPVVPLVLYAFGNRLAGDQRLLWLIAPVSATLAAASAMNARAILSILRS